MRIVWVLACLLLAPAWGKPGSGNPDRGLPTYAAFCASCHGFEGRGDGPMAARLVRDEGIRPLDLADPAFQDSLTDVALASRIREGHPQTFMPAWGDTLQGQEMTDLVAFVRDLRSNRRLEPPPVWDIPETFERGRILYGFRCLACHGESGHGDGPLMQVGGGRAPDLASGRLRDYTDTELGMIVTGNKGHAVLRSSMWRAPLDVAELDALIFFLRGLTFQK